MTSSANSFRTKASLTKGKSSGWAAFDLKQRQKQGLEPESSKDPYPPIPSPLRSVDVPAKYPKNDSHPVRAFSSVVLPSSGFPVLTENRVSHDKAEVPNLNRVHVNNFVNKDNHAYCFLKLKEAYPWADDSLIKDVLEAVGNDLEKASISLKGMAPDGTLNVEEAKRPEEHNRSNTEKEASVGKTCDLSVSGATVLVSLDDDSKSLADEPDSLRERLYDDKPEMKNILSLLRSIPVEPEWEEDDLYLSQRKDALKMMRSAAQHSKAATNAFLRGDHYSAQEHSMKAHEKWLAAKALNGKAAKEILSIRNSNNDVWKLDLHGLHATEAVEALQDRLNKIETQVLSNSSKARNGIESSTQSESGGSLGTDKSAKQQTYNKQRPLTMEVITGVGNHSRGEAALPTAVKSYLIENGYRFDEPRPGMITVRPKFRHK